MVNDVPKVTRAAVIHEYARGWGHVRVEEREVTLPGRGEVLVKVEAAPINPSDLAYIEGNYGIRKPLPSGCGFEAGGTVIAVGEGVDPDLVGQVVACFAAEHDGAWSEILLSSVLNSFPLGVSSSRQVEADFARSASMMLVNPMTAWALLEKAGDAPAIAQTAAASALGQMIAKLALERGLPVVHVVRRAAQVAMLRALGAEYVLDSSTETFDHDFRDLARKLGVRVCFDAVAGETGGRILRLMPSRSRLVIYGGLGGDRVEVMVGDALFKGKAVEGFWLSTWMRDAEATARAWENVKARMGTVFKTEVRARYPLERIQEALADYAGQMSGGKVLITMGEV